MNFKELKIIDPIVNALDKLGIVDATPIQIDAIPKILEKKDILARAATGTGKTAAFVIPILQMMEADKVFQQNNRNAKILVISPNRELSIQISDAFKKIGTLLNVRVATIIGGVYQKKQIEILRNNTDVLVVTPGRCRDLIEQRKLNLSEIKYFILDEVDLILDMGFIDDVKFIRNSISQDVQTVFLSATIPPKIKSLAERMLKNYEYVQSKIDLATQGTVTEELYFMKGIDKKYFLLDLIEKNSDKSFIIFSNMKRKVDDIEKFLKTNNFFARSIHGDKSQYFREEAIRSFKSKKTLILIA
ncbi:MAG: DEAD/DEAH box helicase, partial [Malacoplasma sp.]